MLEGWEWVEVYISKRMPREKKQPSEFRLDEIVHNALGREKLGSDHSLPEVS